MFVVTGANGNTGAVVARQLLQAGKAVRVVVRDARKAAPLAALGAQVAEADIDDSAALERAFQGAAGAYVMSPPLLSSTDFINERERTFQGVARAARRAGLEHLVLLSSIGAQQPSGTGPIRSVAVGEALLKQSGIPVSSVRAAYFIENWLAVLGAVKSDGVLPSFLPRDLSIEMVATTDIGQVAAQALLAGPRGQHVIELAGPAPASPSDVAAAFGRILAREVKVLELPLDAVVPTFTSLGASPHIAGLFREMYEGLQSGCVTYEGKSAELVRGPTSLEQRLRALLR
jgi:uncharacterized protein YbjT (DUF2867 family)